MLLFIVLHCFHCISAKLHYTFCMQGIAPLTTDYKQLHQIIHEQQKEIEHLRAENQLLRHHRFGASSEKLSPDQIPLFFTDPAADNLEKSHQPAIPVTSHLRQPRRAGSCRSPSAAEVAADDS